MPDSLQYFWLGHFAQSVELQAMLRQFGKWAPLLLDSEDLSFHAEDEKAMDVCRGERKCLTHFRNLGKLSYRHK